MIHRRRAGLDGVDWSFTPDQHGAGRENGRDAARRAYRYNRRFFRNCAECIEFSAERIRLFDSRLPNERGLVNSRRFSNGSLEIRNGISEKENGKWET